MNGFECRCGARLTPVTARFASPLAMRSHYAEGHSGNWFSCTDLCGVRCLTDATYLCRKCYDTELRAARGPNPLI